MADRYALIENGTTTNVVLWDGDTDKWQPPENVEAVKLKDDDPVGPGCTYDGECFEQPVVEPTEPPRDWKAEIEGASTLDELKAILAEKEVSP